MKHRSRPAPDRRRVSRETRRALGIGALLSLGLLAAACATPPSPQGWAPPQPITVESQDLVLAARRAHLYALDRAGRLQWEFPPDNRDAYPVSDAGREILTGILLDAGPSDSDADAVQELIDAVSVSGPTVETLTDAIERTALSDDDKDRLIDAVDAVTETEEEALKDLRAFYGDIGVAADGARIYLTSFKGIVFALDAATGETDWLVDAGDEVIGGVAVDGDTVYFGSKDERVHALDATSGEQRWSARVDGEVWATPAIGDGTIYVPTLEGSVYALRAEDGGQEWAFRGAGAGIASRPVLDGDSLYVGSFDKKLYALSLEDGSERWSVSAGNWFWASPVVRDAVVYAASLDGKVYAIDAGSGDAHWDRPFNAGAPVRSTPVIAANGLVVAARNGDVFKLDLESGQALEGSPAALGDRVLADLTAGDEDIVYVLPTERTLYLVNAAERLAVGSIALP